MATLATDPIIWEVLIHLLSDRGEGTDAVVRFTAANALRECVGVSGHHGYNFYFPTVWQTVNFDMAVFSPFLPAAVTELVKLMHEVDTTEMKRRLAKSLNVIIEQSDSHITPHVQMVAECIPGLCMKGANSRSITDDGYRDCGRTGLAIQSTAASRRDKFGQSALAGSLIWN